MKENSKHSAPEPPASVPATTVPPVTVKPTPKTTGSVTMKANFNRSALAEALGLLTSVVPSRTPKPILRCVQITADEKEVRMSRRQKSHRL
jgi:hypothetical protein